MKDSNGKNWWQKYGWIVLLILFVFVLIYAVYKSIQQQEDTTQLEREKQLKQLESRRDKLRKLIGLQRKTKAKFGKRFDVIKVFTRLTIVSILAGIMFSAKFCYNNPSIEQYLAWLAMSAILLYVITYLRFGYPIDLKTLLKSLEPRIEAMVFGKYLGIDDAISKNEDEFAKIEEEIRRLQNLNRDN